MVKLTNYSPGKLSYSKSIFMSTIKTRYKFRRSVNGLGRLTSNDYIPGRWSKIKNYRFYSNCKAIYQSEM